MKTPSPCYDDYNDRTIAAILAKQNHRTATGLPFTRARVAILRAGHHIPVYQPPAQPIVGPGDDDAVVVTITEAERLLKVSRATLYRWIRDGFITAEQITPGAPWRIRIDQPLRDRIRPEAPEGWLSLDEAAKVLRVARQTVLHKVQRRQPQAFHVNRGRRKGLLDSFEAAKSAAETQHTPPRLLTRGPAQSDEPLSIS